MEHRNQKCSASPGLAHLGISSMRSLRRQTRTPSTRGGPDPDILTPSIQCQDRLDHPLMNAVVSGFGSIPGGGHHCPPLAGVAFNMTVGHVKRRGWPNVLFIKE